MNKQKAKFAPPPYAGCVRRKTDVRRASKQFWYVTKELPYAMDYWFMLARAVGD